MSNDNDRETGARKLAESHTDDDAEFSQRAAGNKQPQPYGLTEADTKEGAGLALQSHAQDSANPSPQSSNPPGEGAGGSSVEKDARGQFVQGKENKGGENNGVSSASPRVTTGTDDATFENDPGQ